MKPKPYLLFFHALLAGFTFFCSSGKAQGKVVINEYLPWPSNGCGVGSEYVELYNFGPGPVNIGCYVLTDGDFSVTIPPNTFLLPGEYFVLAGTDVLTSGCGGPSNVTVDLNWYTCNCTSGSIPATGDGFFTDGGGASEQVVLLFPDGTVADAIVRASSGESSSSITTASLSGGCAPFTFDLDDMTIHYEMVNESTGRGNVFARRVDGDCGWVKHTTLTAGAPNFNAGGSSGISAGLTITNGTACPADGSAIIEVLASDYTGVFPMDFTLARDVNGDNQYTLADAYTSGTDASAPDISFSNLEAGRYRAVIASALGCDLKLFNFNILPCGSLLSPLEERRISTTRERFLLQAVPGSASLLVQWPAVRTEYSLSVFNDLGQVIHREKLKVASEGMFSHRFSLPGRHTGICLLILERTDGAPGKYVQRFFR